MITMTTRQPFLPIDASTAGTVGELIAAADLMERGFTVYMPIQSRRALCDLVTMDRGGNVERIQVKCGIRQQGTIKHNEVTNSAFDRLAIVLHAEPVVYKPPFDP